ncbi:MAG: response regulator transcription factor [Bacteroidetes bacterium]|nr:MAG: response regulator transcription factor [Bacteroidota bacterium]
MGNGPSITLLIADDHTLVRQGLVQIFSLYKEFTVLGEAADGREAVRKAIELHPRLVLMDLNMPDMNGIEATRLIKKASPEMGVVIVSAYDDVGYVTQVYHSGANGYLLKTSDPQVLRQWLNEAVTSDEFFCPHLPPHQLRQVVRSDHGEAQRLINLLTSREREILQLIAEAQSHQQIADRLNISVRTVDTHHHNILSKLGIHDSVSLVTFAIKNGLVVLPR